MSSLNFCYFLPELDVSSRKYPLLADVAEGMVVLPDQELRRAEDQSKKQTQTVGLSWCLQ